MFRNALLMLLLLTPVAAVGGAADGGGGQWWASEALRVNTGNGINAAISLWRSPEDHRAELRIMVMRQVDAVDATAAWLWVGGDSRILSCERIEASFLRTEGFRSCFSSFPGVQHANTVSRCPLDWEFSERIVNGASVELQIDTELKLLKRKRLSARKLDRMRALRPILD